MKEVTGDLWELGEKDGNAIVITTNGAVTKLGRAVMGRGVARQAKKRFAAHGVDARLGQIIKVAGNHVHSLFVGEPYTLVTFPVKHHWIDQADPELIVRSAGELKAKADKSLWAKVYLPRPGCGNGRLEWDDVKPIIEPILDDRFTVVNKP